LTDKIGKHLAFGIKKDRQRPHKNQKSGQQTYMMIVMLEILWARSLEC